MSSAIDRMGGSGRPPYPPLAARDVPAQPGRPSGPRGEAPGTAPRIHVKDLTMAYGSFVIQRDLDFVVQRGEVFVIMGGSGCGKSTLLNHMIGLKAPARGDVVYDGESFWGATAAAQDDLRRRLG